MADAWRGRCTCGETDVGCVDVSVETGKLDTGENNIMSVRSFVTRVTDYVCMAMLYMSVSRLRPGLHDDC